MPTYDDYRNEWMRTSLRAPAYTISLLTCAYAVAELVYTAERFRPAIPAYIVQIVVPLLVWRLVLMLPARFAQRIALVGDLLFTGALLSQLSQPTTSVEATAASTSVKVMATAMFFPWAPRLQFLSASATVGSYWLAIIAFGRLGEPSLILFEIAIPAISVGLSIVGSLSIDRAQRSLVRNAERLRALEADQRKQIRALRDHDRRLRILLEQMPAALWSTDTSLRFTSLQGKVVSRLAARTNANEDVPALFEAETTDSASTRAHRAALSGRAQSYEFTTGTNIFQARVEPMRDAGGRITGTIGVAQDVTEERLVAAEREALSRVLEEDAAVNTALATLGSALIQSLSQPSLPPRLARALAEALRCETITLMLIDPSTGAYEYSASHGLAPEEIEVARVLRLRPDASASFFRRMASGSVLHDDRLVADEAPASPLPPLEGVTDTLHVGLLRGTEPIGFVAAHRRRPGKAFERWQERALRGMAHLAALALDNARLFSELERASTMKSDFLATMSHELRTPLNAIIGYNELMLEGEFGDLEDEQSAILARVLESARELFDLISATLDLSRLEAGRLPIRFADTDVAALLAEVAGETASVRSRTQAAFHWRVPAGLPDVHTDPLKLKVVIKNLISNAVKFTEQGSIDVVVERADDGIEIRVSDSGCGIPRDAIETIFEPFRQIDQSNTRVHGGVGLGLYIVRRFLDLMEGRVVVESEPGKGSTFRVWIPWRPVDRDPRQVPTRP